MAASPPHHDFSPTRRSSDLASGAALATAAPPARPPALRPRRRPANGCRGHRASTHRSASDHGIRLLGASAAGALAAVRSEEHTSELQSRRDLVCRILLEKKK